MRNRTTLGILCILASLTLCFGITPLINRGFSAKIKIVRMKTDAKAGEVLSSSMLEEVEVGKYNLPDDVILNLDDANGKYLTADVLAGDYLLSGKVTDEPERENEYLYGLDGNKQAMSVTISDFAQGLSGKLKSGDVVSVIVPDLQKTGKTVIPTELKYVEVIAVTAKSGNDANTEGAKEEEGEDGETRELPSTVTMLVTPLQSRILAMLEADGEMHLSLVYRGERSNAKKFIEEQDKALAEIEELLNQENMEGQGDGDFKTVGADGTVIVTAYLGTGRVDLISEGSRIATGQLPATASLGTEEGKKAGELIGQ